MSIFMKDEELLKKSFRIMAQGISNTELKKKVTKDSYYNFFSTAPGDNRYVNPLPGFSPATDPRPDRAMVDNCGSLGRQYKRLYDDTASLVTFTVGVPEFTGLLTFILQMFDPVAAIMANKGRSPGLIFYTGQALGTFAFAPMQLISIGFQFLGFLTNTPRNQFYYVKPAMGMYLQSSTHLLNDLMVAQGYIKPLMALKSSEVAPLGGIGKERTEEYVKEIARLNQLFPEVINKDGTIDLFRLVSRGTRKYRFMLKEIKKLDTEAINSVIEKQERMEQVLGNIANSPEMDEAIKGKSTAEYVQNEIETVSKTRGESGEEGNYPEQASAYLDSRMANNLRVGDSIKVLDDNGKVIEGTDNRFARTTETASIDLTGDYTQAGDFPNTNPGDGKQPATEPANTTTTETTANDPNSPIINNAKKIIYEENKEDMTWLGSITDLLQTQFAGGFDAITWRCENNGPVTDSFSNSFASSPLAEKFNSTAKSMNMYKFDMAGGVTGIPIFDTVVNMGKDMINGIASSMQIANIPLMLANNSFVNLPDHWEDTSANIHKESYRFYFEATYAHPYSQITNLWIYFALLAPLFMANAAGPSAYTSPFMLKVFSKSRQIIRIGMVESATVTFGDGVGGWTKDRKPLNMTIDLSIADMEKFISIPIHRQSSVLNSITNPSALFKELLTDSGRYNDYISRLSGQDYLDTVMKWNQLSRRLTGIVTDAKRTFSSANIASKVNDSVIGDIGGLFYRGLDR